jgi:hypothetical protein
VAPARGDADNIGKCPPSLRVGKRIVVRDSYGGIMRFFFDESGDFSLPTQGEHKCAIIGGLVVPETVEASLFAEFAAFVSTLGNQEKDHGEPKGTLLRDESRINFCCLLNRYRTQVLVTPTTLDLGIGSTEKASTVCEHMKARLFEHARKCVHATMRNEMEELARQWGNLSVNDGLRLLALTSCFWEAIEHSVVFLSEKPYHLCWDSLEFIVDGVRTASLSRDERVFQIMVLMWLTAWTKRRPLTTIVEIHTPDHPFVRNYCVNDGTFDLGRMLRGNIGFRNSADSLGLQMADICSNIVYQAVHDLHNYNGRLPFFKLLMRNCPYGPARGGPGLVHIHESKSRIAAEKYRLLKQVMDSTPPHAQRQQ